MQSLRWYSFVPSCQLLLCFLLSITICACNSSSSGGGGSAVTAAGSAAAAKLSSVAPTSATAGAVVTLSGHNFATEAANNRVLFRSSVAPEIAIFGNVTAVRVTGANQPNVGIPMEIDVGVPSGARSGEIEVTSVNDAGTFITDAVEFFVPPVITGYAVGSSGQLGVIGVDPDFEPLPETVELYGFNLDSVDEVRFVDAFSTQDAPSFSYGLPDLATYQLPQGLEMISVELPDDLAVLCSAGPIEVEVDATLANGEPAVANRIELGIRGFVPFEELGEAHALISALHVPSGVRAGDLLLTVAFLSEPSNSRWELIPEYLDPSTGDYLPCTPSARATMFQDGSLALPGVAAEAPALGFSVGPGHCVEFLWDTRADFPDLSASTRVRFQAANPLQKIDDLCGLPVWESEWIAIDNSGSGSGEVVESFELQTSLDFDGTDAEWLGDGVLSGTAAREQTPGGQGLDDFTCVLFRTYEFDTDAIEITESDDEGVIEVHTFEGEGAERGEFHFRTLTCELATNLRVVGSRPLRIACSGTGDVEDIVLDLQRVQLDLSGEDATAGSGTSPGLGGRGVAGGGDGGDGGSVFGDGKNAPGRVIESIPGSGGENSGGAPGTSVTLLKPYPDLSSVRAGPGGGGGHGEPGESGAVSGSVNLVKSPPGEGGVVRGGGRMITLTAGSGGGGGSGTISRFDDDPDDPIDGRHGGGGGAGGGVVEFRVDGSMRIDAEIHTDGGAGSRGTASGGAGPGGGGSGGSIVLRATGDIEIVDSANLTARGALGGRAGSVQIGGAGADGRIVLQANGVIDGANALNLSRTEPPRDSPQTNVGPLVDPVTGGDQSDGDLDFSDEEGLFLVDTDTGVITDEDDEVFFEGKLATGEFHLTSLTLPDDVELRAFGDNPLVLLIDGDATVGGIIDVSGEPGGVPDISDLDDVVPAVGGRAGASGGRGGDGGAVIAGIEVTGENGLLPALLPEELNGELGDPDDLSDEAATPAKGGASAQAASGSYAGSGGGGGYGDTGSDGSDDVSGELDHGIGGSVYGNIFFQSPVDGAPMFVGGGGGAGGGGGEGVLNDTEENHPGTGGGGAGGFLLLECTGDLTIEYTASLKANGGDAYRAPEFGGNGGGGAGGGIYLRVDGAFVMASHPNSGQSARVQALGGVANVENSDAGYTENSVNFGGHGAPGRIRFEGNSIVAVEAATGCFEEDDNVGVCPIPTLGRYERAHVLISVARTQPIPLLCDGGVRPGRITFDDPELVFANQPENTSVVILYEGATESRDVPGTPGEFSGLVEDPSFLRNPEYLRMTVYLYGDPETGEVPVLDEIRIGLESGEDG